MTDRNVSNPEPRQSQRRLLLEVAGAAVLLAIPVGAAIATSQPIVNPPGRDELDVLSDQRKDVLEQRATTDEESTQGAWEKAREERKKARKDRDGKSAAEEEGS